MNGSCIGIEIGGTNLRIGTVDRNWAVKDFCKYPTLALAAAEDKIEFLAQLIRKQRQMPAGGDIKAVALALASTMDRERTRIYSSPMISGFENLELVRELREIFGLPICIEKDVNILLLYEMERSSLPKAGITAGVFLGTGLGSAMCIDGKVYQGFSGTACELGHIPIPGLKGRCGCGKSACVELVASGKRLKWLADQKFSCPVEDIFLLFAEQPEVQEIIQMAAYAVATEISILDPASVVIGGGVTEMAGFPKERFLDMICENVRAPYPRESLRFSWASGDKTAGVAGAAIYAYQQGIF